MTYNINTYVVTGNISHDPQNKAAEGQKARVSLGVYVNHGEKEGEKAKHVFVTFWDKTAEYIVKYKKKGDQVTIQGFIDTYQKNEDSPEIVTLVGININ